jgi:predicted DNA-binding protein (UPF0251 family)
MTRPVRCRRVRCRPGAHYFKPRGVPLKMLEEVTLGLDEFEAVRLADLERQYQEDAANQMNVSRQTFGNIINSAHHKIADCLVNGKSLKIDGGIVEMLERHFMCCDCNHNWSSPYGVGRPAVCPVCESGNIHRVPQDRGWTRAACGFGRGRRRCGRVK